MVKNIFTRIKDNISIPYTIIILSLFSIVLICFNAMREDKRVLDIIEILDFDSFDSKEIVFNPEDNLDFYGYEKNGNQFTNIIGDSQIRFPQFDELFLEDITIKFLSPLPQDLFIQVYFAKRGAPFSELFSSGVYINKGEIKTSIKVDSLVSSLRVDIGDTVGEIFELDSIVVYSNPAVAQGYMQRQSLRITLTTILSLALIILFTVMFFLFYYKIRLEYVYIAIAIPLGVLYLLILTPFSIPDEYPHYYGSYSLANTLTLNRENTTPANHWDFSGFKGHSNSFDAYVRFMKDGLFSKDLSVPDVSFGKSPFRSINSISYLPQALGVIVARVFSMNIFGVFFMGRFFNLLFYIVCVYLSMKKFSDFKLSFLFIGLMPMALHQAASFSYDSYINGLSILLISCLFNAVYSEGILKQKDYIVILVLSSLLVPMKVIYFPLIALVCLIPKERFKNKYDFYTKVLVMFSLSIFVLILFNSQALSSIFRADREVHPINSGDLYRLDFVFENPIETIKILIRTLWKENKFYWRSCIGWSFSGLSLVVSKYYPRLMIAVLLLSTLEPPSGSKKISVSIYQRLYFLGVSSLVIFACFMVMLLVWTPESSPIIQGVQGRYFIPIVPLVLFAIKTRYTVTQRWFNPALFFFTLIVNAGVLLEILRQTN